MVNVRREMVQGLVRVRILHAATYGPVSGVELSHDLAAVGHKISPGTLYPLLHQMEKAGWVKSSGKTVKGKRRRYYRLTKKGRTHFQQALAEVQQFLSGILELREWGFASEQDGLRVANRVGEHQATQVPEVA
jgi:DNA-binding PadR family transcriptional regulator